MFRFFIQLILLSIFLTFSSYSKNYEKIIINGNERISNETILVFSEIQDNIPVDENSINEILKKLYKSGFFKDVTVKIENNNLTIDVLENPIIQTVFIEGIKRKKTEESLYEILSLKNRSSYNSTLIKKDESAILSFLKDDGYYFSKVTSSYQDLGDNKIDLLYQIELGEKSKISKISFIGDKKFKDSTLKNIFKKLKGENYSLNSIDEILKEIDKIVLNEQFEFLKSTVNESIEDNLINLTFNISESEKFYVKKINILGNNSTREEVIRNNLLVDEGDAFNELLQTRTLNNLRGLNFFSKVESEILDIDNENKKIINITVEEKPTGEIMAGAGVGTGGGTFAFGVSENNFLGRGIEFASDISVSTESLKGIISMNNPNYKGSNRSLNTSLESTITDRLKNYGYKSNKTGFSVGSGFEFYDDLYWNTGVSSYVEKLETDSTASASMKKQEGSYFDTFFNHTFSYDKRDQRYKTSDGYISRFKQNIPLISESYTLTNTYDYKIYNEWLDENVFSIGFFGKASNSLSGKDIKLSDRLFLPASKLRGFESGKVGPKDGADYIGGNYAASINIATSLSQILPNSQNTNFSIFFDAANVWGIDYSSSLSDESKIRSSIGIALDYLTPIGPLSFSLSEPITKGKNYIT